LFVFTTNPMIGVTNHRVDGNLDGRGPPLETGMEGKPKGIGQDPEGTLIHGLMDRSTRVPGTENRSL